METLADLTVLADFEGTHVPECSTSTPLLSIFGPMLTHPSHITFPWAPLSRSLFAYFDAPPSAGLDPALIYKGWCGLQLIITAFKRLELVENPEDTSQVLEWLQAIKLATIKRSLAYENTSSNALRNILDSLLEPVDLSALGIQNRASATLKTSTAPGINGSATSSPALYAKPTASTSFERGASGSAEPQQQQLPNGIRQSAADQQQADSTREEDVVASVLAQAKHASVSFVDDPVTKQKRVSKPNGIARNDVSASALSSFADFSDQPSLDMSESEAASDNDDEHRPRRSPHHGASHKRKIEALASRLVNVTGLNWSRCYALASRCQPYELDQMRLDRPASDFTGGLLVDEDTEELDVSMSGTPNTSMGNPYHLQSSLSGSGAAAGHHAHGQVHVNHYNRPVAGPSTSSAASSQHSALAAAAQHSAAVELESKTASGRAQKGKKRVQRPHDPNRPAFSYSALIGQAILSVPDKRMRLAEIYEYVTENYPYYKKNECGWQNSIRHNLSLQPVFIKVADMQSGKKGCFWTIQPGQEWRFEGGGWQKVDKKRGASSMLGGGGAGSSSSQGSASSSKMRRMSDGPTKRDDYEDLDDELD